MWHTVRAHNDPSDPRTLTLPLTHPTGFEAGEGEEFAEPDVSQVEIEGATGRSDTEAFAHETDGEEDAAHGMDDDATAAAITAAGDEIDAFLNSGGVDLRENESNLDPDQRVRQSEECFGKILAQRDRAKDTIFELTHRVDAMQRELTLLDEEEELERIEEERRNDAANEDENDVSFEDVQYERERLEYENTRNEQWGEYDQRNDVGDGPVDGDHPTSTQSPEKPDRRAQLERDRKNAILRLSQERRDLARLVPEMQRARLELHDADIEAREFGFSSDTTNDPSHERRQRSQLRTAAHSQDTRAALRIHAVDLESPAKRKLREQKHNAQRVAQARAYDANSEVARRSRRDARSRLRTKLEEIRVTMDGVHAAEKSNHQNDVRRLLELKRNTDEVSERVAKTVAAKRASRERRDQQRSAEAVVLLQRGENPHAVFRRRDLISKASVELRKNRDAHETRMAEIRERLQREEKELDRREREAEKIKQVEFFYKEGLGVKAQQRRNAHMMKHGVPQNAKEAKAARYPDAQPLQSLLTTKELELLRKYPNSGSKIPDKVGVEALGHSYEQNWIGSGAHAIGVVPVGEGVNKDVDPDETGSEKQEIARGHSVEDADTDEHRIRQSKILALEKERVMGKARVNFADPNRLYQPQVTCGRVFSGDSFAPSPKVVSFHDFVLGKRYKRKVTLTNVSYSQSTFRVLPFEDHAHATVLEVEYGHPGKMSAGMSHAVWVTFTPMSLVHIEAFLPVSTTTGVAYVPIECSPKTSDVRIVGNDLDFGAVVVGESCSLVTELRNEGAIDSPFILISDEDALDNASTDGSKNPTNPFTVTVRGAGKVLDDGGVVAAKSGVVPGYGSVFLDITFTPTHPRRSNDATKVTLAGVGVNNTETSLVLFSRGAGDPPPVHLGSRKTVDFKTCVIGMAFRDKLEVRNRGATVARVSLTPPKSLRGVFEIIPDAMFVQPDDVANFSLKFKPNLETAERFLKGKAGDELIGKRTDESNTPFQSTVSVPCQIHVKGRVHPVPFEFKANITKSDLVFEPSVLDFGNVVIGETGTLKVRIRNVGTVAQKIGIVGPPLQGAEDEELEAQNGSVVVKPSRYGEILSGESLEIEFGFTPKVVGQRVFSFAVKSLLGARVFNLPCKGWGKIPALHVDGNVLTLPPTAPREASAGSLFVQNKSRNEKTFEISVPAVAAERGVRVAPHVATLQPGEQKRVRVEFCPPEVVAVTGDAGDEKESWDRDGDEPPKDTTFDSSSSSNSHDALPEIFRLALFVKNTNLLRDAAGLMLGEDDDVPRVISASDESGGDTSSKSYSVQHLEVRTATHVPAIAVVNLPEYKENETQESETAVESKAEGSSQDSSTDEKSKHALFDHRERAFLMDFGTVAVGVGETKQLIVRNTSNETVDASPSHFDHEGVFSALCVFRPIGPSSQIEIPIEFRPFGEHTHEDIFVLKTPVGNVRVVLRGKGVNLAPEVFAENKEEDGEKSTRVDGNAQGTSLVQSIDVGDCVFGAQCTTTSTIKNPTSIPLRWSAEFVSDSVIAPTSGGTNRNPFIVSPAGGILQPNAEVEMSITFSPCGQAPRSSLGAESDALPVSHSRATLQVVTSSMDSDGSTKSSVATSKVNRRVEGRCWSQGAFVYNPDRVGYAGTNQSTPKAWDAPDGFPGLRDALRSHVLNVSDGGSANDDETVEADAEASTSEPPVAPKIVVTTPSVARFGGDPVVVSLCLGSATGPEGGADVTYTLSPPEPVDSEEPNTRTGWSIASDASGTVSSGEKTIVSFSFQPPSEAPKPGDLAQFGIEEWVEATCVCSLKGGDPVVVPSEGSDAMDVQLTLRCRLLPPLPEMFKKVEEEETAEETTEDKDEPGVDVDAE